MAAFDTTWMSKTKGLLPSGSCTYTKRCQEHIHEKVSEDLLPALCRVITSGIHSFLPFFITLFFSCTSGPSLSSGGITKADCTYLAGVVAISVTICRTMSQYSAAERRLNQHQKCRCAAVVMEANMTAGTYNTYHADIHSHMQLLVEQ